MNPVKSEVKINLLQTLGEKYEAKLEQSNNEYLASEAGMQITNIIKKEMDGIYHSIEGEVKNNHLSVAHAIIAKKYVRRCNDFVENFSKGVESKLNQSKGKLECLKELISYLKQEYDLEKRKLDGFNEALERAKKEKMEEQSEDSTNDKPRRKFKERVSVLKHLEQIEQDAAKGE